MASDQSAAETAGKGTASEPARYSQQQLEQFIAAHERFVRRQPHGRRMSMMYLQAQERDFSGRLLTEADLTGANLTGAKMVRTCFVRANLFCADLTGVDSRDADFQRADIRGVSLRNADLAGSNLDDADMREAALARANVPNGYALVGRSAQVKSNGQEVVFSVDFSNCSLKRAKLANAKLKGADFSGALLQGADMTGAYLAGARFEGAVLTGAKFVTGQIDASALATCVVDPTPEAIARKGELLKQLESARCWIESGGKDGRPAILDGEDLRPLAAVMRGRALTAMSAKRARAIGVDFSGTQLQGANFEGADLRDADFTGADLRGATFRGANLRHARFETAPTCAPCLWPAAARAWCAWSRPMSPRAALR
jgi:uncharacterized protein YjbI with pentapeptide repeats